MTIQTRLAGGAGAGAVALALLIGLPGTAAARDVTVLARPAEEALTQRVAYRDLDLTSRGGVATLNSRVSGAVRFVCSPFNDGRSTLSSGYERCRDFAWSGAKPQMTRAIQRAHDIAANGTSMIPPVAIVISVPGN